MTRIFALFFLLFSLNSFAGYLITGPSDSYYDGFPHAGYVSSYTEFYDSFPDSVPFNGKTYYRCPDGGSASGSRFYVRFNSSYSYCYGSTAYSYPVYFDYVSSDEDPRCQDSQECRALAIEGCEAQELVLGEYAFISAGNYSSSCKESSPSDDCAATVSQFCASHGGMAISNLLDDGLGNSICSGTCTDGTPLGGTGSDCNIGNIYCDVADAPSDLDFSGGGTGSDVLPPSSSSGDLEHDIDYEPDGTSVDPTAPLSSIQGDKLINAVVKNRNDNTTNLVQTTNSTNQTIVEKSDDIQETISNSANGIIDAVNKAVPFYDGNIVNAIKGIGGDSFDDTGIISAVDGLGSNIDGLGDKIDGLGDGFVTDLIPANFSGYDNLFHNDIELKALTDGFKSSIGVENSSFYNEVKQKFNFSSGDSGGYQANNLDLGKWGSHDVSLARFADFFGGVGNIVYFLAALSALTIVLGGIKL